MVRSCTQRTPANRQQEVCMCSYAEAMYLQYHILLHYEHPCAAISLESLLCARGQL